MSKSTVSPPKSEKVLGVFSLSMITLAAILSVRSYPGMAEYGLACIFFYVAAAMLFLIPAALVCAELATGWPKEGGVYRWVSEAFGPLAGFLAIWMGWMISLTWFPTIVSFAAVAVAYLIDPELAKNPVYLVLSNLCIFWGGTFLNFLGMKISGFISTFGVIFGTIAPSVMLIFLGYIWIGSGNPIHMELSWDALIPDLNFSNIALFASVLLGFEGMELSCYHAMNTKNPQKDYPRAMFGAAFFILIFSILGSLVIATVLPNDDNHLLEGVFVTFRAILEAFGLESYMPLMTSLLLIGPLTGIVTWIVGPAKGIVASSEFGFIPPWMQKRNKRGVPTSTLILQAVVVSVLSVVYIIMPSAESAFWLLTVLASQFALMMFVLIFASAIKLRYSQPNTPRSYKVPGGNLGMNVVAGLALLNCIIFIFVGFVPPSQFETGSVIFYDMFLLVALIVFLSPAYLCYKFHKPHWKPSTISSE